MKHKTVQRRFLFLRRGTAVFLLWNLLISQSLGYGNPLPSPLPAAAARPDQSASSQPWSIPEEMGKIESFFPGTSSRTIVYIQDAHDSLEAQENIAKIIRYLTEKDGIKTVFEEGYEGVVPTDAYFGFIKDRKVKEKAAYFLLDKLRIGGAEYAHINRVKDFNLVGADNIKLHLENIEWYRENSEHKEETSNDLTLLQREMDKLCNHYFPKELKDWMKLKKRFDAQELDFLDYTKRVLALTGLGSEASKTYPGIALLLESEKSADPALFKKAKALDAKALFKEIDQIEDALAQQFVRSPRDRKIFQYTKGLDLLKRLNAIEITPAEYEAVKEQLPKLNTRELAGFIAGQTHRSLVISKRWEENIKNAVRFYEMARRRDQAIEAQMDAFAKKSDAGSAILIFGGFHKEQIRQMVREKGLSCLIVTPKIASQDPVHQRYYRELMTRDYSQLEMPDLVARASTPPHGLELALAGGEKSQAALRGQILEVVNALKQIPEGEDLKEASHAVASQLAVRALNRAEVRAVSRTGKDEIIVELDHSAADGKRYPSEDFLTAKKEIKTRVFEWLQQRRAQEIYDLISGEQHPFSDAFDALLGNALRAVEENPNHQGLVRVQLQILPDHALLRITDQGPGIREEAWKTLGLDQGTYRPSGVRGSGVGVVNSFRQFLGGKENAAITVESEREGLPTVRVFTWDAQHHSIRSQALPPEAEDILRDGFKTSFLLRIPLSGLSKTAEARSEVRVPGPHIYAGMTLYGRRRQSFEVVRLLRPPGGTLIYEGKNLKTGQPVLLKIREEDAAERYENEVRFLEAVKGEPFFPDFYDANTSADFNWIAMEQIPGVTLADWYAGKSQTQKLDLFDTVLKAVSVLHRRGIMHLDLKPANILITPEGEIKIIDFEGSADEKSPALRLVSPYYASPEVLANGDLSNASDVFSLGVILFELLVSSRDTLPKEQTLGGRAAKGMDNGALIAPQLASASALPFKEVILKALSLKPADRYPSAEEFRKVFLAVRSEVRAENLIALKTRADRGEEVVRFIQTFEALVQQGAPMEDDTGNLHFQLRTEGGHLAYLTPPGKFEALIAYFGIKGLDLKEDLQADPDFPEDEYPVTLGLEPRTEKIASVYITLDKAKAEALKLEILESNQLRVSLVPAPPVSRRSEVRHTAGSREALLQMIIENWPSIKEHGFFMFDMQKTLVARNQEATPGVVELLGWLLDQGVRVVINSGNARKDVFDQVVNPLTRYLEGKNQLPLLEKFSLFAASGTVLITFDAAGNKVEHPEYEQQLKISRKLEGPITQVLQEFSQNKFGLNDEGIAKLKKAYAGDAAKKPGTVYELPWADTAGSAEVYKPGIARFEDIGTKPMTIQGPYIQLRGSTDEASATSITITKLPAEIRKAVIARLKEMIRNQLGDEVLNGLSISSGGESSIDIYSVNANKAIGLVNYVKMRQALGQTIDLNHVYYFGDELTSKVAGTLMKGESHKGNDMIVADYPNYPDASYGHIKLVAVSPEPPEGISPNDLSRTYYGGAEEKGLESLFWQLKAGIEQSESARSEVRVPLNRETAGKIRMLEAAYDEFFKRTFRPLFQELVMPLPQFGQFWPAPVSYERNAALQTFIGNPREPFSILEFGGGDLRMAFRLALTAPKVKVTAVEINPFLAALAQGIQSGDLSAAQASLKQVYAALRNDPAFKEFFKKTDTEVDAALQKLLPEVQKLHDLISKMGILQQVSVESRDGFQSDFGAYQAVFLNFPITEDEKSESVRQFLTRFIEKSQSMRNGAYLFMVKHPWKVVTELRGTIGKSGFKELDHYTADANLLVFRRNAELSSKSEVRHQKESGVSASGQPNRRDFLKEAGAVFAAIQWGGWEKMLMTPDFRVLLDALAGQDLNRIQDNLNGAVEIAQKYVRIAKSAITRADTQDDIGVFRSLSQGVQQTRERNITGSEDLLKILQSALSADLKGLANPLAWQTKVKELIEKLKASGNRNPLLEKFLELTPAQQREFFRNVLGDRLRKVFDLRALANQKSGEVSIRQKQADKLFEAADQFRRAFVKADKVARKADELKKQARQEYDEKEKAIEEEARKEILKNEDQYDRAEKEITRLIDEIMALHIWRKGEIGRFDAMHFDAAGFDQIADEIDRRIAEIELFSESLGTASEGKKGDGAADRRSEVRAAGTQVVYPESTPEEISDWFGKKIGFGGVSVSDGTLKPKDFDHEDFGPENNPWKLEYGVRGAWIEKELLPAIDLIKNNKALPEKDPAFRVMLKHNADKGPLPLNWSELPVVPEILFPLRMAPRLPSEMQGSNSQITFNLIPGEGPGVFYPVLIKTEENLENEAVLDAIFDRAGFKEFVGVVNLPGNVRGIVYRIIPAKNEGSADIAMIEFLDQLFPFGGFPPLLKTRFGTVPFDLANLSNWAEMPVPSIINAYNKIYESEKAEGRILNLPETDVPARSEVRSSAQMKPEGAPWEAGVIAWKILKAAGQGRFQVGDFEKEQLRSISKGGRIARAAAEPVLQLLEKAGLSETVFPGVDALKNYLLNAAAGLELYVSVPKQLRNTQNILIGYGDPDLEWRVPSTSGASMADVETAYSEGFLQRPFLTRTFEAAVRDAAPGLPVPSLDQIRSIRTAHVQEGRTEGIFSADFQVKDPSYQADHTPRVIFSISRAEGFNARLETSYLNMARLGKIFPDYVPRVYAAARGVYGRHDDGTPRYLSLYSMQRLFGFTEINNNLENGVILINGYPSGANEDLSAVDSERVKTEIVRIMAAYFERAYTVFGRRLMIGFISRKTGLFTGGPNLQAGDLMIDRNGLAREKDFLRLITARELREETIPEFIHLLLEAPVHPDMQQKQFSAENVFKGVESALADLYGAERGRRMADEWMDEYETAYKVPGFFMRSEVRRTTAVNSRVDEKTPHAGAAPVMEIKTNKVIVFVDGSAKYKDVRARAQELAVLAAGDPKQTIIVYSSDAAVSDPAARSELRETLGTFDLQNIKFVRGSLSQALRPYQNRPNADLVQYSADDPQAALVEKELGAASAARLIRFVGEPGALGYGLAHLQAVKLDKTIEEIQTRNGYHWVSPRASESTRLLQEIQYVTVFAQAA